MDEFTPNPTVPLGGQGDPEDAFEPEELRQVWNFLVPLERAEGIKTLPRHQAEEFMSELVPEEQLEILRLLPTVERRSWMRVMAPDDAADLLQTCEPEERESFTAMLDDKTRTEVKALMAYKEDAAGGLMSPRFARVRPDMSVDQAIAYLRKQSREHLETIYYVFVLDEGQHLLGVVSFRELFIAKPELTVREVMRTELVKADEQMDQEALSGLFAQHGLIAIPVVDKENRLKGIVTVDDIVDVVQEEATEDIHKIGGTAALDAPYLSVTFWEMIRKRAPWLSVLFLGELATTAATSTFEDELRRAFVLTAFIPLIVSSGGNSGSQATTLVIRAMGLGEVHIRDWWRVVRRELGSGLMLGGILGVLGFMRVVVGEHTLNAYGQHYLPIALAIGCSLVGVVTLGCVAGSSLPFLLKRLGFDPASASAPFVATLVDVAGLFIYFSVASSLLRGTLL